MEECVEKHNIAVCFEKIVGIEPPDGFGEPFIAAFSALYKGERSEILAAAYICSLFLSAIHAEFPTMRLHTFTNYVHENYTRFSFNCKMYDAIFAQMKVSDDFATVLLDSNAGLTLINCSKEDVFDALDFYTNR
jgi:hypothetical protein